MLGVFESQVIGDFAERLIQIKDPFFGKVDYLGLDVFAAISVLLCLSMDCSNSTWILAKDQRVDINQPFSKNVGRFLFRMSYLSLLIGLFSWSGAEYSEWLLSKGVKLPDLQYLRLGGADVWLFMGVTIFVIAQVFKRGIEIQTENELTV